MRRKQKDESTLTSLVVQLLHDFTDDLTNRLDSFDVVLGLRVIFLQRLQRKSNCIILDRGSAQERTTMHALTDGSSSSG